jgi:transcriptional regulator with XRE-family HTH domain
MRPMETGFATIDAALGGLITGDNVVWICDSTRVYDLLCDGFSSSARTRGQHCLHVGFGGPRRLHEAVDYLDAGPSGADNRPSTLADELDRRFQSNAPDCIVVDELDTPLRRWGIDATVEFFSRVCPSMLQAGVTAYWSVGSALGRPALDSIRQITQCLVDVRGERLRVVKAEGRTESHQAVAYRLTTDGDVLHASVTPAGGRLARGLALLRTEMSLTQQELAMMAGVTPSAISQAESGTRGLSLDTLLRISDRLGVPIDRLVNSAPAPSYRLARYDRSLRQADGVVALVPDASIGARVYLVELGAGEQQTPVIEHHGIEVIAAVRGLVQIDLGDDRPVLRSGDALVVETAKVNSWRNLRREPAQFFRLLRD